MAYLSEGSKYLCLDVNIVIEFEIRCGSMRGYFYSRAHRTPFAQSSELKIINLKNLKPTTCSFGPYGQETFVISEVTYKNKLILAHVRLFKTKLISLD